MNESTTPFINSKHTILIITITSHQKYVCSATSVAASTGFAATELSGGGLRHAADVAVVESRRRGALELAAQHDALRIDSGTPAASHAPVNCRWRLPLPAQQQLLLLRLPYVRLRREDDAADGIIIAATAPAAFAAPAPALAAASAAPTAAPAQHHRHHHPRPTAAVARPRL